MPDSNSELERVKTNIGSAIRSFCKTRVQTNPLFFMSDLVRYVSGFPGVSVAPNSPARILQIMRRKGLLNYVVVNRSKSMYKVMSVA